MTSGPTPAGWYDDPEMVNTRRYWNGLAWTEHRQERAAAPPPPGPEPDDDKVSLAKRLGLIALAIVLGIVAIYFLYGDRSGTTFSEDEWDPTELATSIEADLAEQDFPRAKLTCDDPGPVEDGDITYCRGRVPGSGEVTVKVLFDDGGYSWETL